jgi:enoyl-CoA hydratase/carnithine racemase
MTERVVVNTENHVATVTLNRADKHNAVDVAMFEALIETGEALATDQSLRAVVLHGAGDSFCAGIDVSVFAGEGIGASSAEKMQARAESPANFFQSAAYVWRELPVPVIAALHGVVFGAGLQIALAADIRYATADTQLAVMEIKWGLIPDMSLSTTLPHLMPVDKALELAWSGKVINGTEAGHSGLVTEVRKDPLVAAQELARTIAGKSPDAVRAIKKLFYRAWRSDAADLLRLEADLQTKIMMSPNQLEAATANAEKRVPGFGDAVI